ncbi:NIPSNAP family protein [Paradesertivirga mongoliensis]|uniref:NIPSNAP family protein n=1 Tax=Paradesertivirga mongoliensis TaxID=2100740 RepID=A0ABW4ZPE7_9SPHI|nr:NIPSNAP family protein [Pedobacter mongoliensis]
MKLNLLITVLLLLGSGSSTNLFGQSKKRSLYELKIYHLQNKEQESVVDEYLKDAFVPAMHRQGIKNIGVFKPIDTTQDRRIYVLTPYKTVKQFADIANKLDSDKAYHTAGKQYLDAPHTKAPYKRIESILISAFTAMPNLQVPALKNAPQKRVYELRSYEGATEKIFKNKVHMFNEGGEVSLFNRLGFNAVFYGEVLAGSRMPNLMYMTSFEDKASRDEHWKAFGADAEWKKLSSNPFYKNNVSKIDITFLHPTDYSDI